jgi:hypothetical protein
MRSDLAFVAGCIAIFGAIPYILDTLKGKTHPNIVTWFTWTLLNVINAAAAWSSGAAQTAIFSTGGAIATGAILLVGLRYGLKQYSRFDVLCQGAALVGVVLWKLTDRPQIAVAINVVADFAGWLPTYRHAWRSPHAETWQTFALSGLSAVLTLISIQHYTFIALAFPLYIFCANSTIVSTILARRKLELAHQQV